MLHMKKARKINGFRAFLPQKQFKMLVGWLALHEDEAYSAWNKAVRGEHFDKIKPLQ